MVWCRALSVHHLKSHDSAPIVCHSKCQPSINRISLFFFLPSPEFHTFESKYRFLQEISILNVNLSFTFKIKPNGSGTNSNVGMWPPHTNNKQFSDTSGVSYIPTQFCHYPETSDSAGRCSVLQDYPVLQIPITDPLATDWKFPGLPL